MKKEKILEAIYTALDEVNMMLPINERIEKSESTLLIGNNGVFDSLQLMNFIIELENQIELNFETTILLTDQNALSHVDEPFASVKTLVDYLTILLEK
jgi:acyl carrier protein